MTTQGYRLSPQQRRIVTLGGSASFTTRATLRECPQNLAALVARHEILRTSFRTIPGAVHPVQVIESSGAPPMFSSADNTLTLPSLVADAATMRILFTPSDREPMQFADVAEWQNELAAESTDAWPQVATREASGELRMDCVACRIDEHDPARLLAAWAVLLRRRAVADGVAWLADGRTVNELRDVAGPLSRYLPLDLAFDDADDFSDVVARTALVLERDANRQETFSFETAAHFVAGFDRIELGDALVDVETTLDRFDVRLSCRHGRDGVRASIQYDTTRYTRREIEYLSDGLRALLASPETTIRDLPILGARERTLVLDTFNDTASTFAMQPVHRLLCDDSTIVAGDETYTLAQLRNRARTAPGGRVALFFERGPEMVAAMIAVLESGSAYVPIDPDHPLAHIESILDDAAPLAVLTTGKLAGRLPSSAPVIRIDEAPASPARHEPDLDDAAYVLYTSGSTGAPKGVVVGHAALANHMLWMQQAYPLTRGDVVLQKTPYVFDASVWEFWAPLMAGARLVMAPPGAQQSAITLIDEILRHGVTILQVVPAMLALLVAEPRFAACTSLRRVFCGGEPLTPALAHRFREVSGAELINLYGPTETTIDVTHWRCDFSDRVAIGSPIANARLYVLDADLRPRPLGARGEIWIGGRPVAHGYHRRPALTAERFVPDPFAGGRMYRSGDEGAWRADGTLELFGRSDDQIKVRGVRVELAEIDAVAGGAPGVQHAAAVHDRALDRIICWYAGDAPETAVRAHVEQRLPRGSAPSLYLRIDELPRTTSGKIDRRALSARCPAPNERIATPPRDTIELRLCHIWERTLGIPHAGVTDSFFDLGGHSLLAVSLTAAIEKEFHHRIPLSAIFTARTIEQQAALLRAGGDVVRTPLVPIRTGEGRPLFLVHPTGGNVLCYAELAEHLGTSQPLYALQDPGLYEPLSPYDSLEEQAAMYVRAIREVQPHGPYLLGGWSSGGVIAFEMAQQLRRAGNDIALLAMIDSQAPLESVPVDETRLITSVARLLSFLGGVDAGGDATVETLAEAGRAARLLPPDAGDDDVRRLFSVFRANVDAVSRYVPSRYPRRITLFRAVEPLPDSVRGAAMHTAPKTNTFGWESLAAVRAHDVPGHHLNMVAAPHVRELSARLRTSIADANRIYELPARAFYSIAAH